MLRRIVMLASACLVSALLCAVVLAGVARPSTPSTPSTASASRSCGGRYHQFTFGHQGILILHIHGVSCPQAQRLAHSLVDTHISRGGYRCVHDPQIRVGGGGERCSMGPRSIVFGFE